MTYGFVYCLANDSFPDLYKIGCTERSPQQRADDLSRATGVPSEFVVLGYIECANFQQVEREIHRRLENYRPNDRREFFKAPLELISALFFHHPANISWVDRCMRENTGVEAWMLDDPYSPRIAANA